MEEEVEEERWRKRQFRRKIKQKTGMETEERRAGERDKWRGYEIGGGGGRREKL